MRKPSSENCFCTLADRSQEIIEETVGTDSPAGRAIAENVGRHLREGPAGHAAPSRPAGPPDDDEDFESESFLRG